MELSAVEPTLLASSCWQTAGIEQRGSKELRREDVFHAAKTFNARASLCGDRPSILYRLIPQLKFTNPYGSSQLEEANMLNFSLGDWRGVNPGILGV